MFGRRQKSQLFQSSVRLGKVLGNATARWRRGLSCVPGALAVHLVPILSQQETPGAVF